MDWSSAEAKEWQAQLADLAATLVELGIDADIDLFHLDEAIDWTRFGPSGIQNSDMTVIVLSEAWAERWSGTNAPTVGAGAAAEADTLRGLFVRNQAEWQRRVVIVMLPGVADSLVPPDLERVSRLYVDLSDPDSIEAVVRLITGQPRFPKPKLGRVPVLAPDDDYRGKGGAASELRLRLMETRRRMRTLKAQKTDAATVELRELTLRESALQGFIDAILKNED
ncbi:MAG: hypothetical protein DI534_13735 [Leifsonia xyli]|nr:MAG: hypothetical protein DI534_13735 [Leifsonia xyli]